MKNRKRQARIRQSGCASNTQKIISIAGQHDFTGQEVRGHLPTLEAEEAAENANHPERIKDYVVALQPFTVLGELQTKYPYFQNREPWGHQCANGRMTARSP